ncbi:peptidylprolyl isomerase [Candidatus Epulonipiscioides gigas]|nr:peptidylprolyl isomerase [Epulopiscium sp. SCG-C07WGA-EpuloA2]
MKKLVVLLFVLFNVLFVGCFASEEEVVEVVPVKKEVVTEEIIPVEESKVYPVATITIKDYGDVVANLYYDVAPNTVSNFIDLAEAGFYDGLTLHRIIEGFMLQGGDPNGDGTGGPGYSIKGEFASNDFKNNLKHKKGILSMARAMNPDSAGSQFFIMFDDAPHLDGEYAAFGEVISGLDVVDKIEMVETGKNNKPVNNIIIEKIIIDRNDIEVPEVEKILVSQ